MHLGFKTHERAWILQAASVLEYLWVAGLACVVLTGSSLPSWHETVIDSAVYLSMGTVFPLAVLLVCLCERHRVLNWLTTGLKIFFVLFALYQFYYFWVLESSFLTFCVSPVPCALIAFLYWRSQADRENHPKRWMITFLIYEISLVSWIAAHNLITIRANIWQWAAESWPVIPVLVVATGLSAAALFWQDKMQPKKIWRWTGHLVALLLFAILCGQTDSLHDGRVYSILGFEHHWAYWIGPIDSVRDGGWLLWDVPSQYGFLSILALAALPISDAWQALYVAQSVLLFLLAAVIYSFLVRWGTRLHNYLFAVLFTISIVFLLPGPAVEALAGVQPWPDIGPLRYLWLLVSVVVLWFFLCRKTPSIYRYLWVGSFCWVMGILWSFESGAFCSSVFVSAMGVLMVQQAVRTYQAQHSWRQTIRVSLPFVVVPVGMLLGAVAVIWIYYKHYLGVGPDWLAYFEYAMAHVGNESLIHLCIKIQDRIGMIVAVLCTFATIAVWKYKVHPDSPQLAATVGGWFAFYSSLLLYVIIKHPIFMDSGHVFCLLLGIFMPVVDGISRPLLARLVRCALLPILAFQLTITFGYSDLARVVKSIKLPEQHLSRTMYPMEPAACLLLDYAGLGTEAPLACNYFGCLLPPPRHQECQEGPYTNSHSWLPKPLVMLSALPASRQDVYIERCINRMPAGGWLLIERLKHPRENRVDWIYHPYMPKVIRQLAKLPVNHWNTEYRAAIFRRAFWREVTHRTTVCKGQFLLTQLSRHYIIQGAVENDHWLLYRCIPRKGASERIMRHKP